MFVVGIVPVVFVCGFCVAVVRVAVLLFVPVCVCCYVVYLLFVCLPLCSGRATHGDMFGLIGAPVEPQLQELAALSAAPTV